VLPGGTVGLLLSVIVTAASVQDGDGAHRMVAAQCAAFCTIALVRADGGHAGRFVWWANQLQRTMFSYG
jgi:hypothetical protein